MSTMCFSGEQSNKQTHDSTKLSHFAKHKPMFFLFRSNANILLQHFCRPEVQLKTTDEIKNSNHGALVFSLISA